MTTRSATEETFEESMPGNADVQLQVDTLQNIPATAWTVTPDGQLDFINRFFLEVTGQTLKACSVPVSVWNTHGSDLPPFLGGLHPDHQERVRKIFWDGIRSGQPWGFEAPFQHSDGKYHWHQNRAVPVYGTEGELLRFVGTSAVIDELKLAEEKNKALLEVSSALNGALAFRPFRAHFSSSHALTTFTAICQAMRRVMVVDWAEIALYGFEKELFEVLVSVGERNQDGGKSEAEHGREGTSSGWVFDACLPLLRTNLQQEQHYADESGLAAEGMQSYAVLPLMIDGKGTGVLRIASKTPQHYNEKRHTAACAFVERTAI
ncbi:MAG: PAS domain-containing protein [Edaphobacter sp.]